MILSTEQLYAIDPDVIVLPTSNGYHPASELLNSADFEKLEGLKAIKNKRVYAMPWSPMNCARRVEYPIDILIIAKAAYPQLFSDIKVHKFVLDFYKDVYGVSEEQAKALRSEQILDWTVRMTFKPGAFKSNLLFLFVLLGALLLCMIAALMLGDYKISIAKILDVLNLKIFDIPAAGISKMDQTVIFEIRMPRILTAVIVGFALSNAGAIYQACFKNPLMEPFILGG